jgi:hypothetical protein
MAIARRFRLGSVHFGRIAWAIWPHHRRDADRTDADEVYSGIRIVVAGEIT